MLDASFHLEGEVLHWFRWLDCLNTTPTWLEFTKALCMEFRLSEFKDSAEALFKLRHTCSLHDYISEFRRLATRLPEVGSIMLKSCFIGKLKKELKSDVKLLKPDAISIAMQLDAKLTGLKPHTKKYTTTAKP